MQKAIFAGRGVKTEHIRGVGGGGRGSTLASLGNARPARKARGLTKGGGSVREVFPHKNSTSPKSGNRK